MLAGTSATLGRSAVVTGGITNWPKSRPAICLHRRQKVMFPMKPYKPGFVKTHIHVLANAQGLFLKNQCFRARHLVPSSSSFRRVLVSRLSWQESYFCREAGTRPHPWNRRKSQFPRRHNGRRQKSSDPGIRRIPDSNVARRGGAPPRGVAGTVPQLFSQANGRAGGVPPPVTTAA